MLFSRDANQLVLMPLEKIFEKMSRFAAAPLDVAWIRTDTEAGDDPGGFEMQLINDTFLKLTSLMVVRAGYCGQAEPCKHHPPRVARAASYRLNADTDLVHLRTSNQTPLSSNVASLRAWQRRPVDESYDWEAARCGHVS